MSRAGRGIRQVADYKSVEKAKAREPMGAIEQGVVKEALFMKRSMAPKRTEIPTSSGAVGGGSDSDLPYRQTR